MERGVEREVAERVFEQIRGFSGFGFPKAHAAAFGLLAYQSTWLRVHYGPEFLCALLNEQPMGFYPPDALVHEAQRRGIEVLPPRRQPQRRGVPVEEPTAGVRIGLGYVTGLKEEEARALVAERERGGAYRDLADLAARSGAGRDTLERLAWAGACEIGGGTTCRGARRSGSWASSQRPGAAPVRRRRAALRCRCPLPAAPALRALDRVGAAASPTTAPPRSASPSTRWRCCGPTCRRAVARARDLERLADGGAWRSPGWWSRASGRRPPRA